MLCVGSSHAAEPLPTKEAARKFADGLLGSVGAGNFGGTVSQITGAMELPASKLKDLEAQLSVVYTNTLVTYGDAIGSEFLRQASVGESLFRVTYLAKYQRGAIRWNLLFYRGEKGWVLADVRTDPNLHSLFAE